MRYELYADKPAQPEPSYRSEKIGEFEEFGHLMNHIVKDHNVRNFSAADIRVVYKGEEWHLSNQEILAQIESFAREYAEEMNKALNQHDRYDAVCPECGKEYVQIVDPELRVCGNCSDENNNGPRLEKKEEVEAE